MKLKLVDIRQRHIRDFMLELKRLQPEEWEKQEDLPMPLYYDLFCRAAITANWFEGEVDANIEIFDDLKYNDVVKLATAVGDAYNEATVIDPN